MFPGTSFEQTANEISQHPEFSRSLRALNVSIQHLFHLHDPAIRSRGPGPMLARGEGRWHMPLQWVSEQNQIRDPPSCGLYRARISAYLDAYDTQTALMEEPGAVATYISQALKACPNLRTIRITDSMASRQQPGCDWDPQDPLVGEPITPCQLKTITAMEWKKWARQPGGSWDPALARAADLDTVRSGRHFHGAFWHCRERRLSRRVSHQCHGQRPGLR